MLKNRLTKRGRIERKKRRAKAKACNVAMAAHSRALADAPSLNFKTARQRKALRFKSIAAKRASKNQPAPFLIGGEGA